LRLTPVVTPTGVPDEVVELFERIERVYREHEGE
jgi:hypothetical protein